MGGVTPPTPCMDNQESISTHGYLFILCRDPETCKLYLDSFLDVSPVIGPNLTALMLKQDTELADSINGRITAMGLRIRYASGVVGSNLLLIRTEFEMTADEIEVYVNSLSQPELKQFLKDAKF